MFGNQYLTKTDIKIAEKRVSNINQSEWVYTLNILIRIFHFVPPQTAHSTQCHCPAAGESRATKSLLCLTLIKKLFRLFAVEIRVVGLRPDVSTVPLYGCWTTRDLKPQRNDENFLLSLYLAGTAVYIVNRARKSMLHLYRILFGLRNIFPGWSDRADFAKDGSKWHLNTRIKQRTDCEHLPS
jgi:hypothetical protein